MRSSTRWSGWIALFVAIVIVGGSLHLLEDDTSIVTRQPAARSISPALLSQYVYAVEDSDNTDSIGGFTTIASENNDGSDSKEITGATFTFRTAPLNYDLYTQGFQIPDGETFYFSLWIDTRGTNLTISVREFHSTGSTTLVAQVEHRVDNTIGGPVYENNIAVLFTGEGTGYTFSKDSRIEVSIASTDDAGFFASTTIYYGENNQDSDEETRMIMIARGIHKIDICTYEYNGQVLECGIHNSTTQFLPNMPSTPEANLVRINTLIKPAFGRYDIARVKIEIAFEDGSPIWLENHTTNYSTPLGNDPIYLNWNYVWKYNSLLPGFYNITIKAWTREHLAPSKPFSDTVQIQMLQKGVFVYATEQASGAGNVVTQKTISPAQSAFFYVNVLNAGHDSIVVNLDAILASNQDECGSDPTPSDRETCWLVDITPTSVNLTTPGQLNWTTLTVSAPTGDLTDVEVVRINVKATIQGTTTLFNHPLFVILTDLYTPPYVAIWADYERTVPVYNSTFPTLYENDRQFIEINTQENFYINVTNRGSADDVFELFPQIDAGSFSASYYEESTGQSLNTGTTITTPQLSPLQEYSIRMEVLAKNTIGTSDEGEVRLEFSSQGDVLQKTVGSFTVVRTRGIDVIIKGCECPAGEVRLPLNADPQLADYGWFRVQLTNTMRTINEEDTEVFQIFFDPAHNQHLQGWQFEVYRDLDRSNPVVDNRTTIQKDKSNYVYLHLKADSDTLAGNESVYLFVQRVDQGVLDEARYFNLTLPVKVVQYYGTSIVRLDNDNLDAAAGESISYSVQVENPGNGEELYDVRLGSGSSLPAGWTASFNASSLSMPAFSSTQLGVMVSIPADASPDSKGVVDLEIVSTTTGATTIARITTQVTNDTAGDGTDPGDTEPTGDGTDAGTNGTADPDSEGEATAEKKQQRRSGIPAVGLLAALMTMAVAVFLTHRLRAPRF